MYQWVSVIKILIKIGLTHPNALIYPLIVMKYSSSKARKLAATSVLDGIMKKHKNFHKKTAQNGRQKFNIF